MKIRIAPSLLAADFTRLAEEVHRAERAGADMLHCDVMDGVYVPNISFGFPVIRQISKITPLPLDVHMMTSCPRKYIDVLRDAGALIVTVHSDAMAPDEVKETIRAIRDTGMVAALALRPACPAEEILPYVPDIGMVLVMTVEPGFGGQKYIPASTRRIAEARRMFTDYGLDTDIEVDGGIKRDNVDIVLNAGATVIVAGSAVYSGDVYENTKAFADHFKEWEAAH